jgi:hypothetical protein
METVKTSKKRRRQHFKAHIHRSPLSETIMKYLPASQPASIIFHFTLLLKHKKLWGVGTGMQCALRTHEHNYLSLTIFYSNMQKTLLVKDRRVTFEVFAKQQWRAMLHPINCKS